MGSRLTARLILTLVLGGSTLGQVLTTTNQTEADKTSTDTEIGRLIGQHEPEPWRGKWPNGEPLSQEQLEQIIKQPGEWTKDYKWGEGVDLSGFLLVGADLQGADLQFASLEGSMIQGANLSYAVLGNSNLRAAHMSRTNLDRAVLSGSDLANAELRNASLNHADLRSSNLSGADMWGATLRFAQLHWADLYCC